MAITARLSTGMARTAKSGSAKGRLARRGARRGVRRVGRNAYLQALVRDQGTRGRVRDGVRSTRMAYLRATRRGDAAEALLDDRRTRRELRHAVRSFRDARARVRTAEARGRRRKALGIAAPVALVTAGGAVAASDGLRQQVIGAVRGRGSSPSEAV